jgi:hypothetical protein
MKEGQILCQGTFRELMATSSAFRNVASTVAHDESQRNPRFKNTPAPVDPQLIAEEISQSSAEHLESES